MVPRSIYQNSLTLRTLMLRLEAPTKAAVRGRNLGPPVARARGAALTAEIGRQRDHHIQVLPAPITSPRIGTSSP